MFTQATNKNLTFTFDPIFLVPKILQPSIEDCPIHMLKGQEDKYYTKWFNVSIKDGECGAGYFGITKKYSNILSTNCHEKVQIC